MIRVAINGYGRIGRNVHRQFLMRFADVVEVVAVNASSAPDMRAYLLKYDSLHGRLLADVRVDGDDLLVNGKRVRVVQERDPSCCPWQEFSVDVVVESTGNFLTWEEVCGHLQAGAKRVVVTAPMKDTTPTIVPGVNDDTLAADMDIISTASCTTNCIAPVIKVIDAAYGVESLLVSSVHAYTASQNLLDNKAQEPGELRRARAATLSVIPTKTGAVRACDAIFPHLKGRMDGMAFRVPVPTVSCAYMAFLLRREATVCEIHQHMRTASLQPELRGILAVSDDECVSIDFQTDPHSSIVDAPSTKVVGGRAAQIVSWYDNEWGYAMRVTEMTLRVGMQRSSSLPYAVSVLSPA
ncbi:hypothetical protein A3H22_00610 [Candidatus Peribacteria bacterium RIFCSPLOWO2_12_FULL_55_15]|nr:MAG: hypothetical protein A2789_02710 [Candidatus Peribacteria bacterium RIFCSPHIGHO2_01_FULL_54_22]OGJ62567.1 MAG: hypothetical protein A3D12_02440 [Candidatus Peribacteria bacterium RIFCSPHIGHO2_02_FULL_55_24]OGJ63670.1 MAG: hypothetical protein A3E47_01040 [Candidatus Peribacteria bacterium RIFCSPHIGHO2_12_FULL_54_10]OGJ68573.1 MAG: hypothetical protein A2947_01475 [Candidatus Peribacteria bacterium RIFCSPLOWO2_01_FULL_54_110]OGJ69756.1 MAG: hypothetical protein A3H90_01295 [Candidatus Pe